MEYTRKVNLTNLHNNFNSECNFTALNINNFKTNKLMKCIVQNCSYDSGLKQKNYIVEFYSDIYNKLDFDLLKLVDSFGGLGDIPLIDGITPKVFSYLREAIIFYNYYIKYKDIKKIDNLVVIGGGYGMELVIIFHVLNIMDVEINNLIGIDMENIAKLQNELFKNCKLDHICKSYDGTYCPDKIDIVYSNCCLAELDYKTNYIYFNNYCNKGNGFYIIWGLWCADIPEYYKQYNSDKIDYLINDGLSATNINTLIMK